MNSEAITDIVAPVVAGLGYELWGIDLITDPGRHGFCIFIEHAEGISVEDCALVSRHVQDVLLVKTQQQPILEVSSPGLARRLFTLAQYEAYIGHEVMVTCHVPLAGRRRFQGPLESTHADAISMRIEGDMVEIPITSIKKAQVVPVFD